MVGGIALIKGEMPQVYRQIEAMVLEIGPQARALVRRALRGEPNCFWACERGFVVGTPFSSDQQIAADTALAMVRWGSAHVCIFGQIAKGLSDGKN